LNATKLPPKEEFHSQLNECDISSEDYEYAHEICNTFICKTFKDYHDHYLMTDVLLLSDVFENFCITAMTAYGLDPAQYLTLP